MIDVNDLAMKAWATVITKAYDIEIPAAPPIPGLDEDERAFAVEFARLVLEEAAHMVELQLGFKHFAARAVRELKPS